MYIKYILDLKLLHIYGVKISVNNQNEAFYSAMVFFYLYGISCTQSVYFVL